MADSNKLEGVTVMWVEDDNFLSEMIAKKLKDQGANLEFAASGEDAVKQLDERKPDVLLLDILLPGMDGYEVLKQMKQKEELKDVPVILFSNLGQQEDIDKGYKLGADKFLVKATIDLNGVVDEITKLLKEKQSA
ncbi:MAG: response regulator [Candidatus Paceibacterota bacterium]